MKDETDRLFYLGAGPVAAVFLGAALVPLRGWTTASNFSFFFLALIIAVAEYGGRAAALATAVASALSLDFFLTQPYLQLSISEKGDLIACLGLAGCGLLVAALADRRPGEDRQRHSDVVHAVLDALSEPGSLEARLGAVARRSRDLLPLAAVVVRDNYDVVIASSASAETLRPVPVVILHPGSLLHDGTGRELTGPLPTAGGRIPLAAGGRQVGWLVVWGDGSLTDAERRRRLTDLARAVALALAAPEEVRPT